MSAEPTPAVPVVIDELPAVKAADAEAGKRRKVSQEKIMVIFTLIFVLGVLVSMYVPEGWLRGVSLTAISLGAYWMTFKSA
jgi:hypothetical protein